MHHPFTARPDQMLLRPEPRAPEAGTKVPGNGYAQCVARAGPDSTLVRSIIKARALRRKFFDDQLFADPAWDILLELYALKCEFTRVSVSKLSVSAHVPCTTALRWIDKLESEGLVERAADPLDGRRIWIDLSELGWTRMRNYLATISFPQQGC